MKNWPAFERRARPHPDPYIEEILVKIDALKPKDNMTPYKLDAADAPSPGEAETPAREPRKLRAKGQVTFGGRKL